MRLMGRINALVITGVVVLGAVSAATSITRLRSAGLAQMEGIRARQMKAKEEKLKDLTQVVLRAVEDARRSALDPVLVAEAYRARLVNLVQVAHGILEAVHRADDGLGQLQKMERAKALVKGLRYDDADYFWINDTRPAMVMHPFKPELDGQDLSEFKDPNGKRLFVEFVKAVEHAGEGFVDYMWPKPGHDQPVPKLSYVKQFQPWGWIIGTGVYMDDAEQAAREDAKKLVASFRYGPDGQDYFFIQSLTGVLEMHPIKPELNGVDQSDLADPTGKKFVAEMMRAGREAGGGFVSYLWPKPGSDVAVPKLSYVGAFEPWGWLVGTGVYIDDVEQRVAAETAKIEAAVWREIGLQSALITAITAAVVALAVFLSRRIVLPLRRATEVLGDIAEGGGDLTRRLDVGSRDEFGALATQFNSFAGTIQDMVRDVAGHSARVNGSSGELSALSAEMSLGAAQMASRSATVASAAEEMSANMATVAVAMEQASGNLGVVSTAVDQMTSTIREIAANTERASAVTSQAVSATRGASTRVDELGRAADRIGKVTLTINEISEQTKLLALNATIEAARAGEAGKGFAVVANEIKDLARQTAAATGEIRERVEGIQQSTAGTVKEIGQISKVIQDVNEMVLTIASAVEEQSSTRKEIATSVGHASPGVHEANGHVA
ncbi:MAG: methyl-accepting chemotaxis protein, partial [Deferrisomatales bacterium]